MIALLIAANLAQAPLQPWEALVGHCWTGPAPGKGALDTHCFESVYGGQHVRDRHEVKVAGKTVYAGETLYSVEGDAVTFTYWNSLGGVGRGKAVANAAELQFSGDMRATPSSVSEHFDSTWRKTGAGFEINDEGRDGSLFRRVD